MSQSRFLSFTLLTASILTGCNQCSKEKDASPASANASQPAAALASPQLAATSPASEGEVKTLQTADIKVGTGAEAIDGKTVSVLYTGTLTDGTKFDSTKDRGTPFSFVLGSGMVITGWDQGIKGMKEGGLRKLVIPSDLAYGEKGVGGIIPPNATLIFEVELQKVE